MDEEEEEGDDEGKEGGDGAGIDHAADVALDRYYGGLVEDGFQISAESHRRSQLCVFACFVRSAGDCLLSVDNAALITSNPP